MWEFDSLIPNQKASLEKAEPFFLFFFEKKNQKTFHLVPPTAWTSQGPAGGEVLFPFSGSRPAARHSLPLLLSRSGGFLFRIAIGLEPHGGAAAGRGVPLWAGGWVQMFPRQRDKPSGSASAVRGKGNTAACLVVRSHAPAYSWRFSTIGAAVKGR